MRKTIEKRFTDFVKLRGGVVCIVNNVDVCAALSSNGIVTEYRDGDILIYSLTGGDEISLVKEGNIWREETLDTDFKISQIAIDTIIKRKAEDEAALHC